MTRLYCHFRWYFVRYISTILDFVFDVLKQKKNVLLRIYKAYKKHLMISGK